MIVKNFIIYNLEKKERSGCENKCLNVIIIIK